MTTTLIENKEAVLVFRTNIQNTDEINKVAPLFDKPEILKWNIDLDDCDKVLRVVIHPSINPNIIDAIKERGFECFELE